MSEKKVAVVTGGSSGIGLCTARALRKKGCTVYEFSRRESSQEGVTHIHADVTDEASVREAVKAVLDAEGQIDILVNCAGFGISGAIEFTELEDAKRQFDVNFFGMVSCCKAVLTHMRKRGSGRIVNISSVAGAAPIPFQAFYSASKAAINSYTCALANEVRPYGVTAAAVQPGDIHTGFTSARKKSLEGDDEYGGRIAKSVATMEHDELNGMKPEIAGEFVAKVALKNGGKPLYAIGIAYKGACFLTKVLPCRFLNWLIGKIYAG